MTDQRKPHSLAQISILISVDLQRFALSFPSGQRLVIGHLERVSIANGAVSPLINL